MSVSEELRIPATYLRMFAREHSHPQAILARFGVADGDRSESEAASFAEFFELVRTVDAAHSDRGWHLGFARRLADHFHGPLTFALISARTIGDGLGAFARFVQIRAPYFRWTRCNNGTRVRIEIEEFLDLSDIRHVLIETSFRVLLDYVATIGDVNLKAASLSLAYSRTKDRVYYGREFECDVLFDQSSNVLDLPAAWMVIPNLQYDESTWANAIAQCELALSESNLVDIVARTRAYIDATLSSNPRAVSINDAARTLGSSVRTLIRRLRENGSSFQALHDNARQERALRLLTKPNLTVEQIATILGFTEAANFSRAFKRWFGVSPRRYRQEHTG